MPKVGAELCTVIFREQFKVIIVVGTPVASEPAPAFRSSIAILCKTNYEIREAQITNKSRRSWAINTKYLDNNIRLVWLARAPDDETEDGEEKNKADESKDDLAAAREAFIVVEVVVSAFFLNHVTLRPTLVVPFPLSFSRR